MMSENKKTMEAVESVLRCGCSISDGATLVVLCLAVSMVLDSYLAMTRRQGQEHECAEESSQQASPSLGELHRVQRLAKEIAAQLEVHRDDASAGPRTGAGGIGEDGRTIELADMMTPQPSFFSAATCREMAQNLRESVSSLAKSLVETLRKW